MRQKPGFPATGSTERPDNPGQSSPLGPQRPHVFTHYVAGGNTVIPSSETTKELAEERLQNCSEIQITAPERIRPLQEASFKISVKNVGAGHYLPTGLSEVRQVWLHVKVESTLGATIFESGQVDKSGSVDPKARMFNIVLADKDGNHTSNVALADHVVSDTRIPPKGTADQSYTITAPLWGLKGAVITAVLKYRSAPQSLANALLESAASELPIIEMASATATIGR